MKSLKLNVLKKAELKKREMSKVKGGYGCTCRIRNSSMQDRKMGD